VIGLVIEKMREPAATDDHRNIPSRGRFCLHPV
jgi:hypothetical protein